jgi:hypothetical protein
MMRVKTTFQTASKQHRSHLSRLAINLIPYDHSPIDKADFMTLPAASPYRLFIDDDRDPPFLEFLIRQGSRDLVPDGPWVVARSQPEAQQLIRRRGLPEMISFDHDYGSPEAGNGHDLATWLVEEALDGRLDLRGLRYQVHSRNPVGQINIRGVLDSYLNSLKEPHQ